MAEQRCVYLAVLYDNLHLPTTLSAMRFHFINNYLRIILRCRNAPLSKLPVDDIYLQRSMTHHYGSSL